MRKERRIKESEYEAMSKSFEEARGAATRLSHATRPLWTVEWLGGSATDTSHGRAADNYAEASEAHREVGRKIIEARRLLTEADHELAMLRAMED